VSLEEVAAVTRVPLPALRSIEEGRLDELPGEVFVRGFLRAYARCLRLDPEDVVTLLDRPAPEPSMPLLPAPDLDLRRRRIASPALLLVLILASLLLTLVLWHPVAPPFSANGTAAPTGSPG
jgi:cytoskeletal protein RodZ